MQGFFVITIIIVVIFYIASRFYIDRDIEKNGCESIATIISSRQISANEGGSINAEFLITFTNEQNQPEQLHFSETIPQMYASQVQPGSRIAIKYLRKNGKARASIIFKKTI